MNSYIVRETTVIFMLSQSRTNATAIVANMILALLVLAFVGMTLPETSAQGEGVEGNQATVVIPFDSSASVGGLGFEPLYIGVSPGATIIWDNQDNGTHTATSGNPDTETPDVKFDTGHVASHQKSKPVTMPTEPGEYSYFLYPAHASLCNSYCRETDS
jgi:plastocyanin